MNAEKEKQLLVREYRKLLKHVPNRTKKETVLIRKAFDMASEAHKDMKRKSGESYIFHPVAVANIVAKEIGLGAVSVACALLHDTVEDTYITIEDIKMNFGNEVAFIVDGLTKLSKANYEPNLSIQVENYTKVLLTLFDDVRVIFIKIADRLHNIRTLGSMSAKKRTKIASETLFLYAPIADRLGLYDIKMELENLSFEHKYPTKHKDITLKIKKESSVLKRYIEKFALPIKNILDKEGIEFKLKIRDKSKYSIYRKIMDKGVSFENIYDILALRIVLLNIDKKKEKLACWNIYSLITSVYTPIPDRLRDWVSVPKSNGYEALHTTLMSPTGQRVEVQIRTQRMNDIAERGYASHWRYKTNNEGKEYADLDKNYQEAILDKWLYTLREKINKKDSSPIDFIRTFHLDVLPDEIMIFTPKGSIIKLSEGATVLDFAFKIHTNIGGHCMAGKVNGYIKGIDFKLKNGDQVEVITGKKQQVEEFWLSIVSTYLAKQKIKILLKKERDKYYEIGRKQLHIILSEHKVKNTDENVYKLMRALHLDNISVFYFRIAKNTISNEDILKHINYREGTITESKEREAGVFTNVSQFIKNKESLAVSKLDGNFTFPKCCTAVVGESIFAYINQDKIEIHRTECKHSNHIIATESNTILPAFWKNDNRIKSLTTISLRGIDSIGIVSKITSVISNAMDVNMKALNFTSENGIFNGDIKLYIYDINHLEKIFTELKNIDGILHIVR